MFFTKEMTMNKIYMYLCLIVFIAPDLSAMKRGSATPHATTTAVTSIGASKFNSEILTQKQEEITKEQQRNEDLHRQLQENMNENNMKEIQDLKNSKETLERELKPLEEEAAFLKNEIKRLKSEREVIEELKQSLSPR
jgi:small-conductance mechanosensitive channel